MKELIFLIVRELFGSDFAEVLSAIAIRGTLCLNSLMHETKHSFTSLKEILLILLKHNFIDFSYPNPDKLPNPEPANAEFRVNPDAIMNTLRYPAFLEMIGRRFPQSEREAVIARAIIEMFMLETSLNIGEVLGGIDEGLEGMKLEEDDVLGVMVSLIKAGFVVRSIQGNLESMRMGGLGEEEKEERKEGVNSKRKRRPKGGNDLRS